jgi:hypothetical protein
VYNSPVIRCYPCAAYLNYQKVCNILNRLHSYSHTFSGPCHDYESVCASGAGEASPFRMYARLLNSEAQHVGEFQIAADGSNDGNILTDDSAFQSKRNHVADPYEAHMGVYARTEVADAACLRPPASRARRDIGIMVARAHTGPGLPVLPCRRS